MEERYRDGLGTSLPYRAHELRDLTGIEGRDLCAVGTEPTGNAETIVAVHQGWQAVTHERVELGTVLAADLDHVLESLVGDERHPRAPTLEQYEVRPLRDHASDAVEHGLGRVVGGRRDLERLDRAVREEDQVRERAARVDRQQRR